MTTPASPTALDLLKRTEAYLSALHGSVARHDNLAANLGCAGCELRDQVAAELRRMADETQQQAEPQCTCGGPISSTTLDSGITYEQHRRDCAVMTDSPAGAGEEPAEVTPVVCEGFQWIGQPFRSCDRCGQPAWEHVGEDVPVEGAGPFDNRRTVRPWGPGEADRIRAKWAPAVGAQQPKEAEGPRTVCVCGHTRAEHVTVGGPFGCGRLLCTVCNGLDGNACKEFEAL